MTNPSGSAIPQTRLLRGTGMVIRKTELHIFRPSTGRWYFDTNLDGFYDKSFRFGNPTDQVIAGDWDGDEKDGIALFRSLYRALVL